MALREVSGDKRICMFSSSTEDDGNCRVCGLFSIDCGVTSSNFARNLFTMVLVTIPGLLYRRFVLSMNVLATKARQISMKMAVRYISRRGVKVEVGGTMFDRIIMKKAKDSRFVIRSVTLSPEVCGKQNEIVASNAIQPLGTKKFRR